MDRFSFDFGSIPCNEILGPLSIPRPRCWNIVT